MNQYQQPMGNTTDPQETPPNPYIMPADPPPYNAQQRQQRQQRQQQLRDWKAANPGRTPGLTTTARSPMGQNPRNASPLPQNGTVQPTGGVSTVRLAPAGAFNGAKPNTRQPSVQPPPRLGQPGRLGGGY